MIVNKKFLLSFGFLLICLQVFSQKQGEDIHSIRKILHDQQVAWNNGDLEKFMKGYWRSDSLKFIGKNGVTLGWQATLDRYKKSYPDKTAMGELCFDILHIQKIAKDAMFVIGKWTLSYPNRENVEGHFSLLWRKIEGKWVIVADHSS